jgi:excisionase family DNA binding protein
MTASNVVKLPTAQEIEQAKETSRTLSKYSNDQLNIKIFDSEGNAEDLVLPGYALNLLLDILTQMSKGNAVSFLPINAELTTQQAANLLNVSRPYLVELLEKKQIPYRKVGTHRRLLAKDVIAYKEKEDESRLKALDELTTQAQELDMGYE